MSDALEQALSPGSWPTLAFVLTRTGGFMVAAPLWSISGIPRPVRAAVAAVLSVALLPAAQRVVLPEALVALPVGMTLEFVIGLAIGLAAAVIVYGMAMAGEVLAIQMGLSLGPAASPLAELAVPGIGQMQSFLAMLIYLSVGGHLMLLRGLSDSLTALPPGGAATLEASTEMVSGLLGTLFGCALRTAAPTMVALLLIHVAIAITGRAVPQIHAILLAFPVTIGVGLFVIGASLPVVGAAVTQWMADIPERVALVIQSFQPQPWGP